MRSIKVLLALFAVFISFSCLNAQNVEVTWGKDNISPKKTTLSGIIGSDKEGFFVLRTGYASLFNPNPTRILEKYSKEDNALIFSRELKVTAVNSKKVQFEALYCIKGKLLLFTSFYDKALNKNTAYAQEITEDGKSGEAIEVDNITAESKRNTGNFDFRLSEDSTKILVYHNPPFDNYADEKFSYKLLDSDLKELWSKKFTLPYKDKNFTISSYDIDNEGNVYMLASIQLKSNATGLKKVKETFNPAYSFRVIAYYYKQDEMKEFEVELPSRKYISDITFNINRAGDVVCAGFYSNKSGASINGTFYMLIDAKSKEVKSESSKEFSMDFLTQFMSERKASKNKGLYSYSLDYLLLRDDGSAVLVGEQYYVNEVCTTDPKTGARRCNYHYYYNDIIVVSINNSAKIDWMIKVPKKQHSVNDGGYYSSYVLMDTKDNLFFMFNENPYNMKPEVRNGQKTPKYLNNARKSLAVVVSVDKQGNQSKEVLFNSKDAKFILRPKLNLQTGSKESLIYGEKYAKAFAPRKYKFGIVKVN